MKTANPVFQVLVTSGAQALLTQNQRPDALKHGQLGVFDYHSGFSINAAGAPNITDIYFAVGINRTTGAAGDAAEDLNKSAAQYIQKGGLNAYTLKGHMNEVPKIMDVLGFNVVCDTDYGIRIEFTNQQAYLSFGSNALSKYFSTRSACCPPTDCGDCPTTIGGAQVVADLAAAINADTDKLVTASVYAYKIGGTAGGTIVAGTATVTVGTTNYPVVFAGAETPTQAAAKIAATINAQAGTPYSATNAAAVLSIYPNNSFTSNQGAGLVASGTTGLTFSTVTTGTKTAITDSAAFVAANPNAGAILRITGTAQARAPFNGGIPIKQYGVGTNFIVTPKAGFNVCNGQAVKVQDLQYGEGKGVDLQYLEYEAGGWNGKSGPYRQRELTGLGKENIEYFASATGAYDQVIMGSEVRSVSGARNYDSDVRTIIAVPCIDAAPMTELITLLDALFGGEPMANDATAITLGDGFCANNVGVSQLTYTADGIQLLS